jgi:hypothetical protein
MNMDLKHIATRIIIAAQSVKSAIESDQEGFIKAIQDIINYHFMDRDINIQLLKVEIVNGRGWLFFAGGDVGGKWEPIGFDISQEYADFLKDLPSLVESAQEAFMEGPI